MGKPRQKLTKEQYEVGNALSDHGYEATAQAIDSVIEAIYQAKKDDIRNAPTEQPPIPQTQATPHQPAVHKYSHQSMEKTQSNRDEQIKSIGKPALWIGLGVAFLVYWYMGNRDMVWIFAIGCGASTVGISALIPRLLVVLNGDRTNNNAVQIAAEKEGTKRETEKQKTERLRIEASQRATELQIQANIEENKTIQAQLAERRAARAYASTRRIEATTRTFSETHMVSNENTVGIDYGGFDEEDVVDVKPTSSVAIVKKDPILTPQIQSGSDGLLDWLFRVYDNEAYNDKGVIVPKKIEGNGSAPWTRRGGYTQEIQNQIIEYINNQRGGTSWLISKHGNGYKLNLSAYPDYKTIQNYIVDTWQ